ncbi:MAG TPA: hypothetical protein VH682_21955, partial [Gemmataceae bacterium]
INQTGPNVRKWDQDGRHNKETTMANGDKVLEQSWQAGEKTFHFVTVTDTQGRQLVTGEDNGNGFVVTRTNPGVGETKFKFDRYGGMWDGKNWVPEQGQKLVERDGKAVQGEWKMIDNKLRWTMTTGTRETNQRIGVFEKYGNNGDGEGLVSLEEYSNGKLSLRQTQRADGTMVTENYTDGALSRKETRWADGGSVVENYTNGKLTRRETRSGGHSVIEDYKNGELTRRETRSVDGTRTVEKYGVENGSTFIRQKEVYAGDHLQSRVTVNLDHTVNEETWGANGVYTRNVWRTENHGAEGSKDHIYKVVIANGEMSVTGYHLKGFRVYNGAYERDTEDGTVNFIYKLKADGTVDKLVYYHAWDAFGGRPDNWHVYSAEWRGEGHGRFKGGADKISNYYFGWEEWKPWYYSNKIEDFARPEIAKEIPRPEDLAAAARK